MIMLDMTLENLNKYADYTNIQKARLEHFNYLVYWSRVRWNINESC